MPISRAPIAVVADDGIITGRLGRAVAGAVEPWLRREPKPIRTGEYDSLQ